MGAWIFLAYNVLVIVWGALVRATGSGAGCGAHWPLCNGEWVPQHPQLKTTVEFIHRGMSGVALVGVVLLWLWSRKVFAKKTVGRAAATAALCFMLSEAAIGAGLVLLRLVAQDTSLLRAGYLSLHLLNTLLLLTALIITAWAQQHPQMTMRQLRHMPDRFWFALGFFGALLVVLAGGIAALGDTLFPAGSLHEGMARDFAPGGHFLVHLRILHPLLAVFVALYWVALALRALAHMPSEPVRFWAWNVIALLGLQALIGGWNLLWLAPIFLQLIHLAMADLVWIALVLFTLHRVSE